MSPSGIEEAEVTEERDAQTREKGGARAFVQWLTCADCSRPALLWPVGRTTTTKGVVTCRRCTPHAQRLQRLLMRATRRAAEPVVLDPPAGYELLGVPLRRIADLTDVALAGAA